MTRDRADLVGRAGRVAAVGGGAAIVAGLVQATIGSRISEWSGDKGQPLALGLLTIALGASAVLAARILRAATAPDDESLTAIVLWLAAVTVVCFSTVGRLWAIPGVLLATAAAIALAACGWHRFRSVVATHLLRGLLGILGAFEVLMAVSGASPVTVVAGVAAGGALIAAGILAVPGRRSTIAGLIVVTVPFAGLTWWTIVTPVLTLVALAIGLATTGHPTSIRTTPEGS